MIVSPYKTENFFTAEIMSISSLFSVLCNMPSCSISIKNEYIPGEEQDGGGVET